ncbi:MAG: hypothetical protein M3Z31_15960 [Pseudomonadota bacterium]|nr:hypothetical protein [Pseudomonadota bacterium]
MSRTHIARGIAATLALVVALPSHAVKVTECAKIGLCYCINDEHKSAINSRIEKFRQVIADQRKQGKAVLYLSVPLTAANGGNFGVNKEVAEAAKKSVEKRFGADYLFVFNPANPEADLPRGSTGTEYMVMWTAVLEGADGMGDFDGAYFAGPQDFGRYFGFDGNNDMGKLDAFFEKRVASDPEFAKAVQSGLTKTAFRNYYALRASSTVSRGAHDEWNIFRLINDKRRLDSKYGTPGQIPIVFDGQGVAPPQQETIVSEGYVGRCAL